MIAEFTIDRSIWLRSEYTKSLKGTLGEFVAGQPTGSYLLREADRKRCCLGIYLQACGVPDEALEGVASPGYLYRHRSDDVRKMLPSWLIGNINSIDVNSPDAAALMEVNDDDTTDDDTKEDFIIQKFSEHGVKVVFV